MTEEIKEKEEVQESVFNVLSSIDVSSRVKTLNTGKKAYSYLPWADAWAFVKESYQSARFVVMDYETLNGVDGSQPIITKTPYLETKFGIMVNVLVIIKGFQQSIQLPVLDGANNAMKSESYVIKRFAYNKATGKKDISYDVKVDAADMSDINNTIMRALVKACALHGLGISLYQGIVTAPKEVQNSFTQAESSPVLTVAESDSNPFEGDAGAPTNEVEPGAGIAVKVLKSFAIKDELKALDLGFRWNGEDKSWIATLPEVTAKMIKSQFDGKEGASVVLGA